MLRPFFEAKQSPGHRHLPVWTHERDATRGSVSSVLFLVLSLLLSSSSTTRYSLFDQLPFPLYKRACTNRLCMHEGDSLAGWRSTGWLTRSSIKGHRSATTARPPREAGNSPDQECLSTVIYAYHETRLPAILQRSKQWPCQHALELKAQKNEANSYP